MDEAFDHLIGRDRCGKLPVGTTLPDNPVQDCVFISGFWGHVFSSSHFLDDRAILKIVLYGMPAFFVPALQEPTLYRERVSGSSPGIIFLLYVFCRSGGNLCANSTAAHHTADSFFREKKIRELLAPVILVLPGEKIKLAPISFSLIAPFTDLPGKKYSHGHAKKKSA